MNNQPTRPLLPFHQQPNFTSTYSGLSDNSVLNVKALVGAFNQEKALVGSFSDCETSIFANLRLKL